MDYHILVEKQPKNGFVATALGWPDCVGVGATKEEAIGQVQAVVADRLANGEVLRVQANGATVEAAVDPWEKMAGRFADDPHWDEFREDLRRIREEANRA